MAKFKMELPTEIMNDIKHIYNNTEDIFGGMTRAGAECVLAQAKQNAPSLISKYGKLSVTYRTPSDGGINTKVYFSGYIPFSTPNRLYFARRGGGGTMYYTEKGVPVDFLAIMYEYGRSNAPFPKKPFFRKSFKKDKIVEFMLNYQAKKSGGLLE